MRIATQNLQWGGEPTAPGGNGLPRLKRMVDALVELNADLLVFTEYKSGPLENELEALLAEAGYSHLVRNRQAHRALGTAIASRRQLEVVDLPIQSVNESWRSIGVILDGVSVYGFYFPLQEAKKQYWDWLLENARTLRDRDVLFVGDFNTGKFLIDEAGETFDCQEKLETLERLGFVDTWRATYSKGRDYTWYSSSGNGFRLDYIWASPQIAQRVQRAWHYHEPRLSLASDHSAVAVDIFCQDENASKKFVSSTHGRRVLKNIFKLADSNRLENRFTAAWGYMLDREPGIAQAVADIFLKDSGRSARVIRVTDHPRCDSLKQPDFCLECDGLKILVEHKVDALLHEDQLENYLELENGEHYVTLIAPAYQVVPARVLENSRYLRPAGKNHFKWSDFHDAVVSQPGWLTQEFAEYMTSLGMAPFTLKGAEDIFEQGKRPVQFEEALMVAASKVFASNNQKCSIRGTASGLGREIRTPHPSLTLIYIWAEQRSTYVRDIDGPVLAVNVFERDDEQESLLEDARFLTRSGIDVHRRKLSNLLKQGAGFCKVTYVASLEKIVQDTREDTVQCLVEILSAVQTDHCQSPMEYPVALQTETA